MAEGLTSLSATAIAARIRRGELTSEAVVTACLDRIAARDDVVHAWVHVDPDAALAQARARDAVAPAGPLHGVPVGVKDLIDTGDAPTAYGSAIHAGHRPVADAVCVQRLRDAGAVVLGKTVTTEFALFHPGPTTNPHDPSRTPGGSSSGSAAAVADGMVPVALGTQTAGSIVRPASFCGVYGYKPTFGAVPTVGVRAIGPSLDTIGPLARTVDDLALTADVMAGGALSLREPDRTPTIGFARTPWWDDADPATRSALDDLAGRLDLPHVALPDAFADLVAAQTHIMDAEAATALGPEHRRHPDLLSPELRALLSRGGALDAGTVQWARDTTDHCRAQLASLFAARDVLLTPAAVGEAPVGLGATGDPLFCRMWTLLGTPAVAVPGLRGPGGVPLGVQVVAAPRADAAALAAARWIGHVLAQEAA